MAINPTLVQLLVILLLPVAGGLGLFIGVSAFGVLVRYVVNYTPKQIQLGSEEGTVQVHSGPKVSGLFAMGRRVLQLEGWAGLCKGLMPALLLAFPYEVAKATILPRILSQPIGKTALIMALEAFVGIPIMILRVRSVVTPHRLSSWRPLCALRILLSASERRHPWTIYKPCLIQAYILTQIILTCFAQIFFYVRVAAHIRMKEVLPQSTLLALQLILSSTAIYPLHVVTYRLYAQQPNPPLLPLLDLEHQQRSEAVYRDTDSLEDNSDYQSAVESPDELGFSANVAFHGLIRAEDTLDYYTREEDVVVLRPEPYSGILDCFRQICAEEGWTTLFRGLWSVWILSLTLIFGPSRWF